ncbi:MAG: diguanylate cyclase [Nitrospinae bacterium]|nr:diguanylate cyclase [Nitrospinota bacterium]
MPKRVYSVVWGSWRFYIPIGVKTLIAFLFVISSLAGGIYYWTAVTLTQQIENEAVESLSSKLKGGWRLYYSRMDQMKYGMLQGVSEEYVVSAIAKKESRVLQNLLNGYAINRPYVDLWAVVDEERRIIARRNNKTGDILEISGLIAKAIKSGEVIQSTEKVEKDILTMEDVNLSSRVERTGIMQVVVVPALLHGTVKGAFVTGILLNNYDWLPNAIYEYLSTESAVFGSILQESKIIASTSLPKSVFSPMLRVPKIIDKSIAEGKGFNGKTILEGAEVYVVADPIFNSAGEVIGGIAVGIHSSEIIRVIMAIKRELFIYTGIGIIFSLLLAALAYRDSSRPINMLTAAMEEVSAGNLDVITEIKTKDEFEKIGDGFNNMIETIQIREERIERFNELSKLLITSLDPEMLLNKALAMVVNLTGSHMGIVYLHDKENGLLKPVAIYGVGESELKSIKIGEGLPGLCAVERRTVVLKNIPDDGLLLEAGFAKVKPKGVAWFAMCYKDKLHGVVAIGSLKPYINDEVKHIEYLVAQIAIALDNAIIHKEVERISITDSLTELYNRRYFFERLGSEFSEAKRYDYPLSLIIMDIDNFKSINDTAGHQQGDIILKELGLILNGNTREPDLWARYGGEEFIGYLPHCGKDEGYKMAEKMRKLVEDYHFTGMNERKVTISAGMAYYPNSDIENIDDMIRIADKFLYEAKRGGKNKVAIAKGSG